METQGSIGFFGKIQQFIDSIFDSLHISARDVIAYVTCFGAGFFLGAVFKRYGKWIVAIVLGAMVIIASLHYFEFISVHQAKLRSIFGLSDVQSFHDFFVLFQERFQKFLIEIILFCIAFVIGFKLG